MSASTQKVESWNGICDQLTRKYRVVAITRFNGSHRDNDPAAREQFVVRLGRELVRRGAPLDTESVFLRHAAVKPIALRGTLAKKKSK
ncbi:uncharacterized protein PG998_015039 [Apiospora kogelbergensis]|uniref:uncharacterized protein n=1 Tax=Apiospora kogelbergensis TaxID=1337665 RepID=UPI00312EA0BD